MIDLEEVAVALDAFPHWDENMRAEVFHAIDVAPEEPFADHEDYWDTPAEQAWRRIGRYRLKEWGDPRWTVTLSEASGYESAPTKEEILRALGRGARMIR